MTAAQYAQLHDALAIGIKACDVNRARAESLGTYDLRGVWIANRDQIEQARILLATLFTTGEGA